MYVQDKAEETIQKYKTTDPYSIAAAKNIAILYTNLGETLDVRGLYQCYKRKEIIHINANLDEESQRAVLAHELGHAIMHKGYNCIFLSNNTMNKNIYERQANLFAAFLLLHDQIPADMKDHCFEEIAQMYHVPIEDIVKNWRG